MHENTSPDGELDVRVIEPRFKHSTIYDRLDKLGPGQSLVIVNDHDPSPLRYQLNAEHPDTFQCLYLEQGLEMLPSIGARPTEDTAYAHHAP